VPDLSIIALVALATARLTGLVVEDKITEPVRNWVAGHTGDDSKVAYLLFCPWCASIYAGTALAALVYFAYGSGLVYIGLLALAASQVAGMVSGIGR
jgi:hypothetical protein